MKRSGLSIATTTVWTAAGLTWSWAAVATAARSAPEDLGETASPVALDATQAADSVEQATSGKVLILRMAAPVQPEVIVQQRFVTVPATPGTPAATSTATSPRQSLPTASAPASQPVTSAPVTQQATQPTPPPPAPEPPPPPQQRSSGS